MADVRQMGKIVPLTTRVISLCQYVCELVFGVDVLDLNLWIQINSVKEQQLCGFWIRVSLFDCCF